MPTPMPECNLLMLAGIATYLPPLPQAYIRTAGCIGGEVFNELVSRGVLEVYAQDDTDTTKHASEDDTLRQAPLGFDTPWLISDRKGLTTVFARMDITSRGKCKHLKFSTCLVLDVRGFQWPACRRQVANLTVDGLNRCDAVPGFFMSGNENLKRITFTNTEDEGDNHHIHSANLNHVSPSSSEIGTSFVAYSQIKSIDLSCQFFQNVTKIGNEFLHSCHLIRSIDLSSFAQVTDIGESFMSGCRSLTAVNLSPLVSLSHLPDLFLSGCTSLKEVTLMTLIPEKGDGNDGDSTIGYCFMMDCESLKSIDLAAFGCVTSINFSFLAGCVSLQTIDLTPLSNVMRLGGAFMEDCRVKVVDESAFPLYSSFQNL